MATALTSSVRPGPRYRAEVGPALPLVRRMANWICCVIVLLLLSGNAPAFEFPSKNACSGVGELCVSILSCPAYQTREDILNNPPTRCSFHGATVLICCDASLPAPPRPETRSSLPERCGRTRTSGQFNLPRSRRQTVTHLSGDLASEPRSEGPAIIMSVKVFGGFDADLGKWPWMALFGRRTDAGLERWFCGGTLITDRHVLTAAHCLRPEQAGTVGVRIGDNDLTTPFEVSHQERRISRIVQHPQYLGSQNDLAVVRLETPVELTEAVQPICLPPAGAEHVGREVEMAGWGLLEFAGEPSDVLQEVPLRVADPAVCEAAYRRVPQFDTRFPGGFQGTKICAASRDGKPRDACRGDSGGPLMVQLTNGTYQLVGVVSTGVGCGNPEFPGLYTKVSAYIDWIVSNLT